MHISSGSHKISKIIRNILKVYTNKTTMLRADFYKQEYFMKMGIFIFVTFFFVIGFVVNITSNQALFNLNLNVVPNWQHNSFLGSKGFIIFMNIISNIFNPLICAAYILIFYLISHRKLEILVFLIWFIFLSAFLSILKQAIHQARPYWVPNNSIESLEWNCYYEYGCPSGHSMMGLIIMEFILRFFSRVHKCILKYEWIFLILVAFLEFCIMLSRVILGMHSFNQVLFGCMLGLYTFVPYYLYVERLLTQVVMIAFKNPKSAKVTLAVVGCICLSILIQTLLTLVPTYDNAPYAAEIRNNPKCSEHFKPYKSFQYKCFEDATLIMAAFGIVIGLNVNNFPHRFAMLLDYTRLSLKYVARFFVTIIMGLIPVALFMNPLWGKITDNTQNQALIIWACQNVAFFFGTFFLVVLAPMLCDFLGLETHEIPQNYEKFIRFEASQIVTEMTEGPILMLGVRETEMTEADKQITKKAVLDVEL